MNVLVLRPDHIGDMLLTTPFLAALRKSFPEHRITVLCGSWTRQLLDGNPSYDEIVVCDYPWLARGSKTSWRRFFKTVVKLRSNKFDIVINLRKAAKAAAVARFIGGGQIWGFDVGKSSWAHSHTVRYRTDIHIADLYLEFVIALGGSGASAGLELYISEQELKEFDEMLSLPDNFAVIAPGAGYPEKLWNRESWVKLCDWIQLELGFDSVFTGSGNETAYSEHICRKMKKKPIDLTGRLSLRQAALLIKKSQFVVSVDSAAMHIASAVKTPVTALFGPTNPVHWGPYSNGRANRVVSKVTEFKLGRGSTNRSGGMERITVEDVITEVKGMCEEEQLLK